MASRSNPIPFVNRRHQVRNLLRRRKRRRPPDRGRLTISSASAASRAARGEPRNDAVSEEYRQDRDNDGGKPKQLQRTSPPSGDMSNHCSMKSIAVFLPFLPTCDVRFVTVFPTTAHVQVACGTDRRLRADRAASPLRPQWYRLSTIDVGLSRPCSSMCTLMTGVVEWVWTPVRGRELPSRKLGSAGVGLGAVSRFTYSDSVELLSCPACDTLGLVQRSRLAEP
jgi:hypothetical protein